MAVSINDFVDNVRADVPMCPDPAIEDAIRDAITDFCKQTWIIQRDFVYNSVEGSTMEELDDASVIEFDGVTPTVPDVGMRPVVVIKVFVASTDTPTDFVPLALMSKSTLATRPTQYWEVQTTNGLPTAYFVVDNATIRVYPVPTINYFLALRAAFKPKRDASSFDNLLYDDWLEEICAGAKYRLFSKPSKPWTDYTVGMFELGLFKRGIGKARILINNNFSSGDMGISLRSFTL